MKPLIIAFLDRSVVIDAPASIAGEIAAFFALCTVGDANAKVIHAVVTEESPGRFAIAVDGEPPAANLTLGDTLLRLTTMAGQNLSFQRRGVPLHAAAIGWGEKTALILGGEAAGKSSLVAWFIDRGFSYIANDNVTLVDEAGTVAGFPEPLFLRRSQLSYIQSLATFHALPATPAGEGWLAVRPDPTWQAPTAEQPCGLIVFTRFVPGAELSIEPLTPDEATLSVLEQTRAVVIPGDPGYAAVAALGNRVPTLRLMYGQYAQIDGVLDFLTRVTLEMEIPPAEFAAFLRGLPRPSNIATTPKVYPVPAASERRFSPKLTIGMATYDDYDGVYFSLQAIRMYHPEILDQVEFLVVDNHPDGVCAEPLKALESAIPNLRYIPFLAASGTAATRNLIFAEGGGEFALCMDCHVFIVPGALRRLLAYFAEHPDTADLLQGPLVGDDLKSLSTHFDPVWRAGMYGVWGHNEAADDPDNPPFDIPMQGLGLFACRRAAWLGFNPLFSGFGGEEGYIHEKYRQAGHRALCLPFLRWMHRFQRPLGPPYRNTWEDRCRNYLIGFRELGLPTAELEAHFAELLGAEMAGRIFAAVRAELAAHG